jgi:ribose transport system permease protein
VKSLLRSEYLVLVLSGVYFTALLPFTDGLASPENLANLLSNLLPLLVVCIGQTIVLITGGIDLSVTSVMALTSVLGAQVMTAEGGLLAGSAWAVPAGVAAMIGAGMAVGWLNGAAIARLQMPPFIVTLSGMMFFSGLVVWLTQSKKIGGLPPEFTAFGKHLGLTLAVALAVAGLTEAGLRWTVFGRWLYAVGHNAKTAFISGVPVRGVVWGAYVFSGACAACAAILYTGRQETGDPVLGQRLLLDIVGATVIGGTSLFGGKGNVLWTLGGALFLTLIDNSLNLLNLSHFTIMMVKGGVILLAAVLDAARHRLAEEGA